VPVQGCTLPLPRREIIMFIVISKLHVNLLGEFVKFEKRLLASSCLSFRPSLWNNEIVHLSILRISVEKIKVSLKSDKDECTLHEDVRTL